MYASVQYVSSSVHPSQNVRLCTGNKRLDLEGPICTYVCRFTGTVRLPIFIQIDNVVDHNSKGKEFESSTLGSSNGIISQKVTDGTNIAFADTESRMWPFDWRIYIWNWSILKVMVKRCELHKYVKYDLYRRWYLLSTPNHCENHNMRPWLAISWWKLQIFTKLFQQIFLHLHGNYRRVALVVDSHIGG